MNYSLRNIPDDLYEKIKTSAHGSNASMNQTIIWALKQVFDASPTMYVSFGGDASVYTAASGASITSVTFNPEPPTA